VASITTWNPKAWTLLFQSRQAMDRMDDAEARRLAQEAVKEDPEFALAYHQLALAAFWHEWKPIGAGAPGLKEVEAAEARANRLPEKERLTLRVFRALVDNRLSDAVLLSDEAVAAYPLDKDVVLQAGDVLYHWEVNFGTAVQYFERALQLDPTNAWAIDHLLDTVWWTGQSARYLPFIEQRAAAAVQYDEAQLAGSPTAGRKVDELQKVAHALLAAGREREGVDLLDRAARIRGTPGSRGIGWYTYLCYRGRMAEAEAEVRTAFARFESPDANPRAKGMKPPRLELFHVLLASGRVREAYAVWENPEVKRGPPPWVLANIAEAKGSAGELEAAAILISEKGIQPALVIDSGAAQDFAIMGDRARARDRILRAKSTPDWTVNVTEQNRHKGDAILAWSEGRMEQADRLIAEMSGNADLLARFYILLLAGSFHFTSADCPGAVKYLEEARAVPWPSQWVARSYHLPLLLQRLATCYERAGDLTKARERNAEMLTRWEKADEDIPLLVEAKALQARLAVK
jgi:tetratricopeptide (TPR) repeat protein